ncbi:MAG: hypothetical protein AB4372_37295 [Xenococcus sp. (in: cyanobacteria)]
MSKYLEILQWLLYNTAIPLMPIPLVWLGAWLIRINQKLLSILSNGQLYFYCTTISAAAIRDIVKTSENSPLTSILVGGIIFFMIFSTFAYGVAAIINQTNGDELNADNSNRLAWTSIFTAIATTILVASSRFFLGLL